MNNGITHPASPGVTIEIGANSKKLVSLLTLAAGAAALPQSCEADIFYTDLNSAPVRVGFDGGAGDLSTFNLTLPGTATFGFKVLNHSFAPGGSMSTSMPVRQYQSVLVGHFGGGAMARVQAVGGFAIPLEKSSVWGDGFGSTNQIRMGSATNYGYAQAGYSHKYLSFTFYNSDDGLNQYYGWVEVTFNNGSLNASYGNPDVIIYGYGYDSSGQKIPMGTTTSVPEPAPMSILALGALTLGSRGIRAWRRRV